MRTPGPNLQANQAARAQQGAWRAHLWAEEARRAVAEGQEVVTPAAVRHKTLRRAQQRQRQQDAAAKAAEPAAGDEPSSSARPSSPTPATGAIPPWRLRAIGCQTEQPQEEQPQESRGSSQPQEPEAKRRPAKKAKAKVNAESSAVLYPTLIPDDVQVELYSVADPEWNSYFGGAQDVLALNCKKFFDDRLREHCGRHTMIQAYMFSHDDGKTIADRIIRPVKNYLGGRRHGRIATWCNKGIHRSVGALELLALLFAALGGYRVEVKRHLTLDGSVGGRCACTFCADVDSRVELMKWEVERRAQLSRDLENCWRRT